MKDHPWPARDNYIEVIQVCRESPDFISNLSKAEQNYIISYLITSFSKIGNLLKAKKMLEETHKNDFASDITNQLIDSISVLGRENGLNIIRHALKSENIHELEQI